MTRPYIDPRTLRGIYNDRHNVIGLPCSHHQPYEACDEDGRYLSLTAALTIAFLAGMVLMSGALIVGAAFIGLFL